MSETALPTPTAGMVVIGNEILTGKVVDTNSQFVCRELNALGVELKRITIIADDFAQIGQVTREFAAAYTWVFTSGGVGPTHDDITITAIATGFGVKAVRHPVLEQAIRSHYKERCTEDHLLMALVPEGSQLIDVPGRLHPQVQFRNVFILPGVPELFRSKFQAIKPHLHGHPMILREIFLKADEGTIAATLRRTAESFPEVLIGSYPNFLKIEYTVKVTVEAREPQPVTAAFDELVTRLRDIDAEIVRVT
ncbi:MAG: competence/damage-inducible protein A [Candidatus Lambdaproteobacteria bacterium]|nr:competence/damage-inducible protein A [Candidatus Lambdaproteobacteria bacterium]